METGIKKRLIKSLNAFHDSDLEESLYQIAAAIEATAKKRYPSDGPSLRVQKFLKDEQDMIYGLSTLNCAIISPGAKIIYPDGEIQRIIYKYIRCGQSHEAEPDLSKITLGGSWGIGQIIIKGMSLELEPGKYLISRATVLALIFSVICANENSDIDFKGVTIPFLTTSQLNISMYVGKKDEFVKLYSDMFKAIALGF